jgi:tRNA A22 N-methylase
MTFEELKEKLSLLDEVTLVETLQVNSYDIVEALIEENQEYYRLLTEGNLD